MHNGNKKAIIFRKATTIISEKRNIMKCDVKIWKLQQQTNENVVWH